MEETGVQIYDVPADTKSAVAWGAAVGNLRGACEGATAEGAAKVQQLCHALSWHPLVALNPHPPGGAGHDKQCADLTRPPLITFKRGSNAVLCRCTQASIVRHSVTGSDLMMLDSGVPNLKFKQGAK